MFGLLTVPSVTNSKIYLYLCSTGEFSSHTDFIPYSIFQIPPAQSVFHCSVKAKILI